jgi:hypothetical protein
MVMRLITAAKRTTWVLSLLLAAASGSPAAASAEFAPAAIPADNGYVGIFADPAGTEPCIQIGPGGTATLHVVAVTGGGTADGFYVAEFRIEVSNPAGWLFLFAPRPDAVAVLGQPLDLTPEDPYDATGVDIAFGTCQVGARVPIGTILAINLGGGPTRLAVKRRNPVVDPVDPYPLFTRCDEPDFTIVSMRACRVDDDGEYVAFETTIDDPDCSGAAPCAFDCAGAPQVDLTAEAPSAACPEADFDIVARAHNASPAPADIDLFIDHVLAGSFAAVPPGGNVTAQRTLHRADCSGSRDRFPIGAVARNAACPLPGGGEIFAVVRCNPLLCGGNLPPDCSLAEAGTTVLWPPNRKLVPVEIRVPDPNGDPVTVSVFEVTSDEPPGAFGPGEVCPDFEPMPGGVRLRAERAAPGNGRVYRLRDPARDASLLECSGTLTVCVPHSPSEPCVDDGGAYVAHCSSSGPGPRRALRVERPADGGLVARFARDTAGPVEIAVYDIAGRLVRVLHRGDLGSGEQAVPWNGTDASGRPVAAGVYFFRLRAGAETQTAKSIWMR